MTKVLRSYRFSPKTLDEIEYAQDELGLSATGVVEKSIPQLVADLTATLKLNMDLDRQRLALYLSLATASKKIMLARVPFSEWGEQMINGQLEFGARIALSNSDDLDASEAKLLEMTRSMRALLDEFDAKVESGELRPSN